MRTFLIAGEASGDHHGAELMHSLKNQNPSIQFSGIGGPLMRQEGMDLFLPMEDFEVHGLAQILRSLPKIFRQLTQVRDRILEENPDSVIFIDYPGFNLRMAKMLRKKGFKGTLIQYISPTVWAWGKGRIRKMEATLDLLLTIFPFEPDCYKDTTLPVQFVGHPLISSIESHPFQSDWKREYDLSDESEILGLFPGSRWHELKRNLPKMLIAAKKWSEKKPGRTVCLSCAQGRFQDFLEEELRKSQCRATIIPSSHRYELMKSCHVAVAAAGTINLELCILQIPTVVVYDISPLNRIYAYYIIRARLEYYSIVNILAGKEVYPEFIQEPFHPNQVLKWIEEFSSQSESRMQRIQECAAITASLNGTNAHQNAASAILKQFASSKM